MAAQLYSLGSFSIATQISSSSSNRKASRPVRTRAVCSKLGEQAINRRGATTAGLLSLSLAAKEFFLSNNPAHAIIPDDDDEELLERVKAKRAQRVTGEVNASRESVQASKSAVVIQAAVKNLYDIGEKLSNGDLSFKSTLEEPWVASVEAAVQEISTTPNAIEAGEKFVAALDKLSIAASKGSVVDGKSSFVTTAVSLKEWCEITGLNNRIIGL